MTNNTNIYAFLLLYSLLSGVFLRAVYDALRIVKDQLSSIGSMLQKPAATTSAASMSEPSETDSAAIPPNALSAKGTQAILLQNTSTVRTLMTQLSPSEGKAKTASGAIIDVAFSLICALTVTLLLFGLNFGEMRWFVIPLAAAGYCLYGETLGLPLRILLSFAFSKILKLTVAILRLLTQPVVKITTYLYRKRKAGASNKKIRRKKAGKSHIKTVQPHKKAPQTVGNKPKKEKKRKNSTFFQKTLDKQKKM